MTKSKSDRPTVFVSMLNASHEEFKELQDALETLADDYRFMLTAKPLQALNKEEAVQVLKEIAEDNEPYIRHISELKRIILELKSATASIATELDIQRQNTELLRRNLKSLASMQKYPTTLNQFTEADWSEYIHNKLSFVEQKILEMGDLYNDGD